METANLVTFICFGLWFVGIITLIITGILYPASFNINTHRKINLRHPLDLLLILTVTSWILMWCFRSMY